MLGGVWSTFTIHCDSGEPLLTTSRAATPNVFRPSASAPLTAITGPFGR
jgi:hypothetical protein